MLTSYPLEVPWVCALHTLNGMDFGSGLQTVTGESTEGAAVWPVNTVLLKLATSMPFHIVSVLIS